MIAILLSYTVTSRGFVYTNSVSAGSTTENENRVSITQIRYEHSIWCGWQDSNLHARALEPKSNESTNSTTSAYFVISKISVRNTKNSNESSCCGARQPLHMTKQACVLPTATTRSARCIRHRRRSHRFPIPPHPQVGLFYHSQGALSIDSGGAVSCQRTNVFVFLAFLLDFPSFHS